MKTSHDEVSVEIDASRKSWVAAFLLYSIAGGLCIVAVILLFRLGKTDLRVPLYYSIEGDQFHNLMLVKNALETGWFQDFPRLGAPGSLDHRDFPLFDNVHFLIIKAIAAVSRDLGLTINVFYLLSFLLITWTSLFVMRRLGISGPVAVVASLLYAFAPYHFMRGQLHIFLGDYFSIPLMVLLSIRICEGKPLFVGWGPRGVRWPIVAFTALTCVLISGSGIYSVFFGLYFLAIASLVSFSKQWRPMRLADGSLVMALLLGLLLLQVAPIVLYNRSHGKNPQALRRESGESVQWALSLSTMLQPTPYHQIKSVANWVRGRHDDVDLATKRGEFLENENRFVALGIFGSCGFVVLLAVFFLGGRLEGAASRLDPLGKLCLSGVLLGVPGGLGNLVAIYVTPNIRCYNRVSIYLAYFSVLAAALILDRLRRLASTSPRRRLYDLSLGALLAVGLFDQMPRILIPDHENSQALFARDRDFFRRVESLLPAGSMVFQLPYAPFPEGFSDARAKEWSYLGYEHIRAYLHTDRIRWASPTMKGRDWDRWQAKLWKETPDQIVAELKRLGFDGICVDRQGYDDRAEKTIAEFRRVLGSESLESLDHRFCFFCWKPVDPAAPNAGFGTTISNQVVSTYPGLE